MPMVLRPDLDPPVTRESILAAMVATQMDRERIRRETGLVIGADGHTVRESTER